MSPQKRLAISDEELINLDHQGWLVSDIAEAYGVTAARVSQRRQALKIHTPRPRYAKYLPWVVASVHTDHPIAVRLRWLEHHENNEAEGLDPWADMPSWAPGMVASFVADLREEGAVIDYSPSDVEGFRLVPATAAELASGAIIREVR